MSYGEMPRIMAKDIENAEDLDFTEEQENWNTYKLSDGTILKVKLVLKGVKRLNKHKRDGTPVYLLSTDMAKRLIEVPSKLKRKGKPSAYQVV